jgi:hypothetical protein
VTMEQILHRTLSEANTKKLMENLGKRYKWQKWEKNQKEEAWRRITKAYQEAWSMGMLGEERDDNEDVNAERDNAAESTKEQLPHRVAEPVLRMLPRDSTLSDAASAKGWVLKLSTSPNRNWLNEDDLHEIVRLGSAPVHLVHAISVIRHYLHTGEGQAELPVKIASLLGYQGGKYTTLDGRESKDPPEHESDGFVYNRSVRMWERDPEGANRVQLHTQSAWSYGKPRTHLGMVMALREAQFNCGSLDPAVYNCGIELGTSDTPLERQDRMRCPLENVLKFWDKAVEEMTQVGTTAAHAVYLTASDLGMWGPMGDPKVCGVAPGLRRDPGMLHLCFADEDLSTSYYSTLWSVLIKDMGIACGLSAARMMELGSFGQVKCFDINNNFHLKLLGGLLLAALAEFGQRYPEVHEPTYEQVGAWALNYDEGQPRDQLRELLAEYAFIVGPAGPMLRNAVTRQGTHVAQCGYQAGQLEGGGLDKLHKQRGETNGERSEALREYV